MDDNRERTISKFSAGGCETRISSKWMAIHVLEGCGFFQNEDLGPVRSENTIYRARIDAGFRQTLRIDSELLKHREVCEHSAFQ